MPDDRGGWPPIPKPLPKPPPAPARPPIPPEGAKAHSYRIKLDSLQRDLDLEAFVGQGLDEVSGKRMRFIQREWRWAVATVLLWPGGLLAVEVAQQHSKPVGIGLFLILAANYVLIWVISTQLKTLKSAELKRYSSPTVWAKERLARMSPPPEPPPAPAS